MAEVKWIKIVVDIFDDEKIVQIEQKENAYAIIVAWFKLLCLAGKQNNGGILMLNNRIPYTDEMLAAIFRMDVEIVEEALNIFEEYGMIEIIEGTVTIPNWGKHQDLEGLDKLRESSRKRSADYRARQKEKLAKERNVTSPSRDSSRDSSRHVTPIDIEEDKEEYINNKEEEVVPTEPPVIQIELIDGTMYDVTQSEIDFWSNTYPAVNVLQEMRNIAGWNHSNPKKRKTRGGIKRHINTWLADKQNKSRTVYNTGSKQPYIPVPDALPTDYDENPFKR